MCATTSGRRSTTNEVTAPTPRPDLFHRSEWITMNIRRRTLLGGMATLPALGALASCGSSGSGDTTEITYGYIPDFNGASLLAIAEDQGLWEENGLTANLQTFTNGPLQIQALGTGDLDFGYIGPDRKSTRLNSSHVAISYAVFCLKRKRSNGRRSGSICWQCRATSTRRRLSVPGAPLCRGDAHDRFPLFSRFSPVPPRRSLRSTLFPYTTLFRSPVGRERPDGKPADLHQRAAADPSSGNR